MQSKRFPNALKEATSKEAIFNKGNPKKLKTSLILLLFIPFSLASATTIKSDEENTVKNNNPPWTLVWEDNFDGNSLDNAKWNRQVEPAGRFNEEWQRYTNDEENAYVEDGKLIIQAIHHSDKHGLNQYSSARLNTAGKGEWQYGRIVARIKLPKGMGVWPAFWTLGANIDENGGDTPWPETGEIDILELYGSKDDAVIEANMHYDDDGHAQMGAVSYELTSGIFADNFHEFELEWNEKMIVWKVDGKAFHSVSIDKPEMTEFHHKHFLLLNLAIGGTWAGRPDESTPFPARVVVDWVRVYQQL